MGRRAPTPAREAKRRTLAPLFGAPLVGALLVGGLCVAPGLAARAHAQEEGAQPCQQEAASADYGSVRVGSVVVLQRHRYVDGDPNWDPRQSRFLGRVGVVTRLSGVDDRGCPGVRVDTDRGRWFWRVRDTNVGARWPRAQLDAAIAPAELPQQCGRDESTVEFGPLQVGSVVVLGRHRPVGGQDNWNAQMTPYVGRTARVLELSGPDDHGCAVVQVDADGRQWFWRVRDLALSDEGGGSYHPGLASDHGRPAIELEVEPPDERVPQSCGMTDDTAEYGPIELGAPVRLGRHRPVEGQANWEVEMGAFVGRVGRVTELVGVDEQGCALLHVDADEGEWFWRARDVHLPDDAAP